MFTKTRKLLAIRLGLILALLGGILGASPIKPVLASTITVTNTNDSGAGSLRQAIADAANGDTITFAPSLAGQTIVFQSYIGIEKSIIIDGTNLSPHIKLSGNNENSVFAIGFSMDRSIVIKGLDIENSGGSAIYLTGSALKIIDVNFSNNYSPGDGGAISTNNYAPLNIADSTFIGNQADGYGGAIYNYSEMTITDSVFDSNGTDQNGGAIYNAYQINVTGSTFTNNSANWGVGAIYTRNGATDAYAIIAQSTFSGNNGTGVYNDGILIVANSTFSYNIGSGIANDNGLLAVNNSTFTGNSNRGISSFGYDNSASLELTNSILANSISGTDCYVEGTIIVTSTNNLIESNGSGANGCGTPLITSDPQLDALGNSGGATQTHALLPGSPAIDAADDESCASDDQRGFPPLILTQQHWEVVFISMRPLIMIPQY